MDLVGNSFGGWIACWRELQRQGFTRLIGRTHAELDLLDGAAVRRFYAEEKPEYVVDAAAKVGGIVANNTYRGEFIYENLMIQNNVIHQSYLHGVKKLMFLGSTCIYPRNCPQPMREEYLLTGELEYTNEPYAIAKIAGIKMCEAYNRQYGTCFRAVMPTNLYGPGDNYHLDNSHVIPAMIRKYHLARLAADGAVEAIRRDEARYGAIPADIRAAIGLAPDSSRLVHDRPQVVLWGSGSPRREFLHVDDMAAACVHVMGLDQDVFAPPAPSFLNVGTGHDITIRETAALVAALVGFDGETVYNPEQPDGTPRKLLATDRITALGWQPRLSLQAGLADAYRWYLSPA